MQSDLKMLEFAARLGLLEKLVSDILLRGIYESPDSLAALETTRQTTAMSLVQCTVPPGTTAEDADIAMEVQTKLIEFAERFFDTLKHDLVTVLEKYPKDGENT